MYWCRRKFVSCISTRLTTTSTTPQNGDCKNTESSHKSCACSRVVPAGATPAFTRYTRGHLATGTEPASTRWRWLESAPMSMGPEGNRQLVLLGHTDEVEVGGPAWEGMGKAVLERCARPSPLHRAVILTPRCRQTSLGN